MRLTRVEDLRESDILAVDVLNSDYTVLLAADTNLTGDLIDRLKRANVTEVYIRTEEIS